MLDCHAHVVAGDTARFPPAQAGDPKIDALVSDPFEGERLALEMAEQGVSGAVLVQRRQIYGFDNSYVCALARQAPQRWKAICAVDAESPQVADDIASWQIAGGSGFRLMARIDQRTFEWLDGPHADLFWRRMADAGLLACVHFFPWNRDEGLDRLVGILERYPVRHLVIDHLAAATITDDGDPGIDDRIRRLAEHGNVSLKFTTIPLARLAERHIDAGAILGTYLDLFGEDRLAWGSDVTQSLGSFAHMVGLGRSAAAHFPTAIAEKLLHGNTQRIYGFAD